MTDSISATTTYFAKPGKENTEETLRLARERAQAKGIKDIVVASNEGDTALRALETFKGCRIVVVTHVAGFKGPDTQEMPAEVRSRIESLGGAVLTTTHAFAGIGRAVRRKTQTWQVNDIIALTLKTMGEGAKVACEIAAMAADSGLVRTDRDVVSIAGSARGADTALVIKPAHVQDFFDLRIKEVICKPLG